MTIAISGTNGVTLSGQFDSASSFGFKNRIINGGMVIDQRNAGAVKTLTASTVTYTVDRFGVYCTTGTGHTYQQVSDAPAGFVNSWKFTVGTGGTPSSGQQNVGPYQVIEGYNSTDFNWGTASAQPATLSFWVKSSLTGTFCVSVQSNNASGSYSYVATFSVVSANTWEYKTITVPANTYSIPYTTNSGGVSVFFGLGSGSTYTTTANTWTSGDFKFATGSVNILGTNGATFYITGVQLEKGSTATSFDYRPYGTELQLAQRYFEMTYSQGTAPATNTGTGTIAFTVGSDGGNNANITYYYKTTKRTAPTITFYTQSGTSGSWDYSRSGASGTMTMNVNLPSDSVVTCYGSIGAAWVVGFVKGHITASAEL